MKRILALILTLVMCFGLCACGSSSKFVGTYVYKMSWFTYTIVIEPNGKGTFNTKLTDSGDVVQTGTVTWVVDDNYISVTETPTWTESGQEIFSSTDVHTSTYELIGSQLIPQNNGGVSYTKVS